MRSERGRKQNAWISTEKTVLATARKFVCVFLLRSTRFYIDRAPTALLSDHHENATDLPLSISSSSGHDSGLSDVGTLAL